MGVYSRQEIFSSRVFWPACAIVLNGRGSIFETTAARTVLPTLFPVIKIEFNNHGPTENRMQQVFRAHPRNLLPSIEFY